jgi:phosphate transport system substrate-binding protein
VPFQRIGINIVKKLLTIIALPLLVVACRPGDGTSGSGRVVLQNKGSDTLVNVAQAWAEAYGTVNSNLAIAVTGGGSGTGISAMINGTVDIANASRGMKESEIAAAQAGGIDPIEFVVGFDALAVFLHPDNPISELSIAQLASIYGEAGNTERWSQLGVTVPGCGSDEIIRVSRQNNSGTFAYFHDAVLGEDEYRLGSRDLHGSKDVVDLVENTPCAIGYSGLAYATEHVSMPCVKANDASDCVSPSVETAIDGSYPIARPLFMYTAGQPEGAVKEYMDWILSEEGQCIILEKGYAPVNEVACS